MVSKVYVVFLDYAYDIEPDGYYILGVFSNYDKAKEVFDKAVEENEKVDKDNGYDMFEKDENKYEGWLDGNYNLYHTTIVLSGYEVDKIYKEK